MGTIINGKIYRNVPGKSEGIETENIKITGESAVEMPSIKATKIETSAILSADDNEKITIGREGNGNFITINDEDLNFGSMIAASGLTIDPDYSGNDCLLIISYLPDSDPQVEGAIWNDNGTLKISAGQ